MSEHADVQHARIATQAELETLEDTPVAVMYPLDEGAAHNAAPVLDAGEQRDLPAEVLAEEVVATPNAAPVLDAGEQRALPAEVLAGFPAEIVAALQGVQAAYNTLPDGDHRSFRAEIQKFIDAAIKQLRMAGGGAKPKRPDAYRFLDEKRAGRRRPARVAAYQAMDSLIAVGWPSARRPPVASTPAQAPHAAAGMSSQTAPEVVAEVVAMPPGWTPEEGAVDVVEPHCVAVVVEEAPDAAAMGTSAVTSAVPPAPLDDENNPSRKKAKLCSDPHGEGDAESQQ